MLSQVNASPLAGLRRQARRIGACALVTVAVTTGSAGFAAAAPAPAPAPAPNAEAAVPPELATATQFFRDAMEFFNPNLAREREARAAEAARQAAAAAEAARKQAEAERARQEAEAARAAACPAASKACVDLKGRSAWLQNGDKTTYGPVHISHGMPGWETPKGTMKITRKVKNEISREFGGAPMPYSVYFTNQGHAFHEGSSHVDSHGCIHLDAPHAAAFFDALNVGDSITIF